MRSTAKKIVSAHRQKGHEFTAQGWAVIFEVINDDDTMSRLPDLEILATGHGLKIVRVD